jgi:hypothetical protein
LRSRDSSLSGCRQGSLPYCLSSISRAVQPGKHRDRMINLMEFILQLFAMLL